MRRIHGSGDGAAFELELTPFVDVIFQLVLFFVFTLKFLSFEGLLSAQLPRDTGPPPAPDTIPLRLVEIFLDWDEAGGGRVLLRARDDPPSGGGPVAPLHTFPADAGAGVARDPAGRLQAFTETELRRPDGTAGRPVHYDYAAPDFAGFEAYLASRRQRIAAAGAQGDIRVRVHYDGRVPWQAVVNILDVCERQKITDFEVAPAAAGE